MSSVPAIKNVEFRVKKSDKRTKIRVFTVLLIILVGSVSFLAVNHFFLNQQRMQTTPEGQTPLGTTFYASIDTMKESRDTETRPLSSEEILAIVTLSASINTNYITVDTHWDYPNYMQQWVDAIHATGHHVWFRSHPNQWENTNGASDTMTPAQYKAVESDFILAHASLFQSGDIFDACSEPEQGHYWYKKYGQHWTSNAPNDATRDYNAIIRDTTDVA